jgi:hypothetical protein
VVGRSVFEVTVVVGRSVFEVTVVVGDSIFEVTVVVGDSIFEVTVVVGDSIFEATVVVGIEVGDTVVEGSVVAGATVVEESGSGLIEVTLLRGAAPFEGKAAPVVLTETSEPDDPSEEPQAETTSADTNKNTAERFFIEATFFRIREH